MAFTLTWIATTRILLFYQYARDKNLETAISLANGPRCSCTVTIWTALAFAGAAPIETLLPMSKSIGVHHRRSDGVARRV
jgi:hypothetical protein